MIFLETPVLFAESPVMDLDLEAESESKRPLVLSELIMLSTTREMTEFTLALVSVSRLSDRLVYAYAMPRCTRHAIEALETRQHRWAVSLT